MEGVIGGGRAVRGPVLLGAGAAVGAPSAMVGFDTNLNGSPNFVVTGPDRNLNGIPDFLEGAVISRNVVGGVGAFGPSPKHIRARDVYAALSAGASPPGAVLANAGKARASSFPQVAPPEAMLGNAGTARPSFPQVHGPRMYVQR